MTLSKDLNPRYKKNFTAFIFLNNLLPLDHHRPLMVNSLLFELHCWYQLLNLYLIDIKMIYVCG